jgi:hypothetical protein
VRPREGNADARAGKKNGGDEMAERQPPPGKHEPHEVAENAERSRTDVPAVCSGVSNGTACELKGYLVVPKPWIRLTPVEIALE